MTYIHIVRQKDITVVVDPVKHLKHKTQCNSIRWVDSHIPSRYVSRKIICYHLPFHIPAQTDAIAGIDQA